METTIEQSKSQEKINPSNDSIERIRTLFDKQKQHLQTLKESKVKERRKKLKKLLQTVFSHREKIQQALIADYNKPALETDVSEIYPTIAEIKHVLNNIDEWMMPDEVDTPITLLGASAYILKEPKGNCLIITPWNYPFYLAISPILFAVAAGNAVILKPSEYTPHTNKAVKELLAKVFDENEVAVIEGDVSVSTELLSMKFDHIHFTGSPTVGKIVMTAAAKNLTSVTLELGGKSPTIVDETANIALAAKKIVWGKYLNEGQTCIAPDYILVQSKVKDALVAAMKKEIAIKYGQNEKERISNGFLSRIVNSRQFNRLQGAMADAIEQGAVVETGAQSDETQNYIDPTILSNVPLHSKLMQEEIFGPILPLVSFNTLEEAVKLIGEKEKPLALYIFSSKQKNIDFLLNHTTAGGTCINETLLHITHPDLPFGGVNNSGIGKSHGKWGFIDFSNERSVLRQHLPFAMSQLLHPPYNKWTKRLIDITMKWF